MSAPSLGGLYVTLGAALFVGAFVAFVVWRAQVRYRAWRTFADRHGWDCTAPAWFHPNLEVNGLHEGRQLSILTERRGHRKRRYTVTVLRLEVTDAVPPDLMLELEGTDGAASRRPGLRDPALEDELLDAALELADVSAETIALFRSPALREHLRAVRQHSRHFALIGSLLEVETHGIPGGVETLEALAAPALALASELDAATRSRPHPERA